MAKKAKAKKTAKKSYSKKRVKRARRGAAPDVAQTLAALHLSLKAKAQTPDQRADASIVGAAQQHAAKGDVETVGSLLTKLGSSAKDFLIEHKDLFGHMVVKGLLR